MGSRVSSQIDVGRLIEAVRSPGIDTRVWCSIAVAVEDSHFDADHGVFVDLILLPSEQAITARVGSDYAGSDFGNYRGKILKDDEVCVVIPTGAPAEGAIVVSRLWSAADKPPTLASEHQDDQVAVLPEGKSARLKVGDFEIVVDNSVSPTRASFKTDSGDVFSLTKEAVEGLKLGINPTDHMALAALVKAEITALRNAVASFVTSFNSHTHTGVTAGMAVSGSPSPPPVPAPPSVGDVKSEFVKSK